MQVIDRLAAIAARIHDHPVAVGEPLFARDLRGRNHEVAEQGAFAGFRFTQRLDVLARHDENVHWRFGVDIRESVG